MLVLLPRYYDMTMHQDARDHHGRHSPSHGPHWNQSHQFSARGRLREHSRKWAYVEMLLLGSALSNRRGQPGFPTQKVDCFRSMRDPQVDFHGTSTPNLKEILKQGLKFGVNAFSKNINRRGKEKVEQHAQLHPSHSARCRKRIDFRSGARIVI